MAKKFLNGVETDSVRKTSGGRAKDVFATDGSVATLPSSVITAEDGFTYFKAAYKSGLTFLVTAEWYLGGVLFTMRQTEITLDAADATFDRRDVIAVDDTGAIIKITGTPGATPIKPTVDPITQLEGTDVIIPAGSAIPEGVVVTNVYYENLGTGGGEWDASQTGGTISLGSANSIEGSVGIEGVNSVSGHQVIFTPAADIDLEATPMKQLNYLFKNNTAINGKGDSHRFIFNGLDVLGNPVSIVLATDPAYSNTETSASQLLSLSCPDYTQIKTLQNIQFQIVAKSAFSFLLDGIRLVETAVSGVGGNYASIDYVDQRDNYILSLIGNGKLHFATNLASFPATGAVDILYVAKDTRQLYLWTGAAYQATAGGASSSVSFHADVASLPATGTAGIIYVASAENSMHEWNGSSYDTLGGGGGGGAISQQSLTDAATLSWNLSSNQMAYLLATGAVGDARILPNTAITSGADGNTYQLTFVQDATGGRTISFETNYKVIGSFDLQPNKRTIVTIIKQGTEADVILTPIVDPEAPQALTGSDIDVSKYFGNVYNYSAPSSVLSYTTNNPTVNGFARCYINAASEPVVYETDGTTPATKVFTSAFIPNVVMELVIESPDGVAIEYYFIER